MSQLAKVFELNRSGLNLSRGVTAAAALVVPLVVLGVLDQEKYFLAVAFGAPVGRAVTPAASTGTG